MFVTHSLVEIDEVEQLKELQFWRFGTAHLNGLCCQGLA
jgi:hypothetical protein